MRPVDSKDCTRSRPAGTTMSVYREAFLCKSISMFGRFVPWKYLEAGALKQELVTAADNIGEKAFDDEKS